MAKKRNWLQIGILLLFLVGFPIVSYIYLKKGYDYRVEAMQELKDYGSIPGIPATTVWGDSVDIEKQSNQIVVLHYINLSDNEEKALIGKYMNELHQQFDGIERVRFWGGYAPSDSAQVAAFMEEMDLIDFDQYLAFPATAVSTNGIQLPEGAPTMDKPLVFLADTTGTVRSFYNLENGREVVRLVEHITFLVPPEKKQKAIFNPEQEL